MNCVLLSQNKLEIFLLEGLKGIQYNNTDSQYTFTTTIGIIQAMEVLKKRGTCQHHVMRSNLDDICASGICQLGLDQYELVQALENSEFVDSYTSHATNPFDTAKILSIAYNDGCWGDKDELLKQL